MIKVYSSHTCPFCDKLKRYLDSKEIAYETLYIDESQNTLKDLVSITGIAGVPVTVFESGEFVLGFDLEKINKILSNAKKEKEKIKIKVKPVKV
ncbi:MAG: glutaredoxin family protein [Ruminococcus sp.]|jgi:glutaredoxin|nr:glutaredoxin family protein [Ruminococcus sp.]